MRLMGNRHTSDGAERLFRLRRKNDTLLLMDRAALSKLRRSPSAAGDLVRRIVPEKQLSGVLKAIARSVQIAHSTSSSKWGLRLNDNSIMLKVGFVEVLQVGKFVRPDEHWFHQLVNRKLVPNKLRTDRRLQFRRVHYRNAPGCDACDTDIAVAAPAYKALYPAHEAAIRIAARSPRRKDTTKDHSSGLIIFLSQELGIRLPQPAYVNWGAKKQSPISEELSSDDRYQEGAAIQVRVNRYERDPAVRERCIQHYGTECSACGVSLADQYGPQVTGLIHVHHLKPLANLGERSWVDPVRDLRPVCPNCHAVIHSISPPRTIEEVKEMVRRRGGLKVRPKLRHP
jgi:5-methylcytosine-specific restriction protein A